MSGGERLVRLVERLGASDPRAVRAAGDELLAVGAAAVPPLAAALRDAGAGARKSAAFLLGKLAPTREGVAVLERALGDEEPKVRKNAAIALGRCGAESAVAALAARLAAEEVAWVRPSLVLALGSLGGEAAARCLGELEPRSQTEREARRKALDRLREDVPSVAWQPGASLTEVCFAVPVGFEDVALEEAVERGLPAPAVAEPGLLRCAGQVSPGGLASRLRCAHDCRLLLAEGPALARFAAAASTTAVAELLASSASLGSWRERLDAGGAELRYRLAVDGPRLSRSAFRQLLERVRGALEGLGLRDSPSRYAAELRLEAAPGRTRAWLIPTFELDERFAYRRADVGAAIDPVLAACLARTVRRGPRGLVLDPTCGSATLLVERALLDPGLELRGVDVSPTAVRAARANVEAAGLSERVRVERADAADPRCWPAASEVLANLPFGVRSRRQDRDLPGLYRRLAENLAGSLAPAGRAVLYTGNGKALEEALRPVETRLRVARRRRSRSGGLDVGAWVLEPHPGKG